MPPISAQLLARPERDIPLLDQAVVLFTMDTGEVRRFELYKEKGIAFIRTQFSAPPDAHNFRVIEEASDPVEALKRAEAMETAPTRYCLFFNNCQHYASKIVTGERKSWDVCFWGFIVVGIVLGAVVTACVLTRRKPVQNSIPMA